MQVANNSRRDCRRVVSIAAMLVLMLAATQDCLGQYYAVAPNSNTDFKNDFMYVADNLYVIVWFTPITLSGFTVRSGNGLSVHPTTEVLYAILDVGSGDRRLVTIDAVTAVATDIGSTGRRFSSLAFNADGSVLYGMTGNPTSGIDANSLYTIDISTAASTFRVAPGGVAGQNIAFSTFDGMIYNFSGDPEQNIDVELRRINPSTFAVTLVPLTGDSLPQVTAVTFRDDGTMLVSTRLGEMYRVTDTGVVAFLTEPQTHYKGLVQIPPELGIETPSTAGQSDEIMSPAFPNPFNSTTTFTLTAPRSQHVRVQVYDVLGRRVGVLHDGVVEPGLEASFELDGARLPGGLYSIVAAGESFRSHMTVALVR